MNEYYRSQWGRLLSLRIKTDKCGLKLNRIEPGMALVIVIKRSFIGNLVRAVSGEVRAEIGLEQFEWWNWNWI